MLHHLSPLGEILRMIVSRADLIALVMRQLPLDPVLMEAHLMMEGVLIQAQATSVYWCMCWCIIDVRRLDAVAAAAKIGYPVVAKAAGRTIVHKSDHGGVRLGLADEAGVRAAFRVAA